ncbi:MAG: tRNA (adenosine(37)-N6)-threonylcarbamoyltransferase complex ATPase subunit type 1 TsaE [Minisyncoccota bacterium]
MEKNIADVEALSLEAGRFVRELFPSTDAATLVTLSGELGAGKTAFAKAAALALGVEETVNSPTFVLEKVYRLPEGKHFKRFVHIDAYRLETGNDLAALGFDELMRNAENLIFLEWPEKVSDALPEPAARIALRTLPDGSRAITYG